MPTALLIIARAVHIGTSILIAGTLTFEVVALRSVSLPASDDPRRIEEHLARLIVWSLVAALLSGVLWFWLVVAEMTGLSPANALSAKAWQIVLLQTNFGHVWELRLALIALAFVLIAPSPPEDKLQRALMLTLWLLSVVVLVSLAWISHAAAAGIQPLGLLGDALQLSAAGVWIGGLAPLVIFITRARQSFSLGREVAPVLKRFSTLSLCCVSVLVVSGICNSWLLVGSIHALFTTPYGWLLLCKLILFGILVGFGARNRFAIKTKMPRAHEYLLPQLRRNVICEACLGAALVAIVACLGVTPPAQHP